MPRTDQRPTAERTEDRYDRMTREELYDLAQDRDVEGRSQMDKDELADALRLEDTGPDAVALLRRQHDEIRALFDRFDELSGRPSQRKHDLVHELITVLVKHSEVEEQVFYPAVREAIGAAEGEIEESLEEHHVAELLLLELDHLSTEAPRYDAKVTVLIEEVRHHLEEEEADLFPLVEQELDEQRRRKLGRAMEELWKVAPTRPHPATPSTPPANLVLGLVATAWDLTLGSVRWVRERLRR